MDNRQILIIEDDTDINNLLNKIFQKAGYDTVQAYSGTEGELRFDMKQPDLIMLDLMLPGVTGEELIGRFREKSDVPIIILSAKTALAGKVEALNKGADDYLTKPFERDEILARVNAALRRYGSVKQENKEREVWNYKNLSLYPQSRKVIVRGQETTLTVHEYELLYLMIQSPEKVFSREHLYEEIWKGGYYGEDNTVNVHVSNLRKKIAAADPGEEYIKTVWGIGFKMS